jgi:hypothetical protein
MSGLFPRILRVHQWIYEHTDGLVGRRLCHTIPLIQDGKLLIGQQAQTSSISAQCHGR